MIIRPTMSITKQRPQISTAEVYRKQNQQHSKQKRDNHFADNDGEIIPEDDFDQMESKANAINYKNRGLGQQAMAKMVPNAGRRTVHEINVEDIQKVEPRDKNGGGSRRLTRQISRTIDN